MQRFKMISTPTLETKQSNNNEFSFRRLRKILAHVGTSLCNLNEEKKER